MDSTTSSSSLRRWQKALAASCQAVSSVATVRLTWTQTWLLPKLPAKGRLPKLVQLATPVTGCWMLVEEWRMCFSEGNDSELNRKFREKPRKIWLGIVGVLADIRAATSRPHSPTPSSQFVKCRHLTHSHVRQVFITDCRKPDAVPLGWQWAAERSWTSFKWFKRSKMRTENYDFTCLMSVQPAVLLLPHRKHSISISKTYWLMLLREIITVLTVTTCKVWVKCRILHRQSRQHIELPLR